MKTKGLLLLASLAMMIMFTGVVAAEGPVKEVFPRAHPSSQERQTGRPWTRSKPEAAKPKSTKAAKTFLPTSSRAIPMAPPPARTIYQAPCPVRKCPWPVR